MANVMESNIVYLSKHLTDIKNVLNHLVASEIILPDEKEEILLLHKTAQTQNSDLCTLLVRKDWALIGQKCLQIFRITGNGHCADRLEGIHNDGDNITETTAVYLPRKWWPEEKTISAFHYNRRMDKNILLVDKVHDILHRNQTGTDFLPHIVTISGIGGVGKTTTSIWYATNYGHLYNHVVWINCQHNIESSFARLAKDLQIHCEERGNARILAQACFSKMSTCKSLFIYDNVESYSGENDIQHLLSKNDNGNVHSILTSRTAQLEIESRRGRIPQLVLDVFSDKQCVQFIRTHLAADNLDKEQVLQLVQLLGSLPLALQIAVATLNEKNVTLEYFNEQIAGKEHEQIENEEGSFESYKKTLSRSLSMALHSLEKQQGEGGVLAGKILKIFAYISPDRVPLQFFALVLKTPKDKIMAAAKVLAAHSLISVNGDIFSVHRHVQLVVRNKARAEWKEIAILKLIFDCGSFLEVQKPAIQYASCRPELKFLTGTKKYVLLRANVREMVGQLGATEGNNFIVHPIESRGTTKRWTTFAVLLCLTVTTYSAIYAELIICSQGEFNFTSEEMTTTTTTKPLEYSSRRSCLLPIALVSGCALYSVVLKVQFVLPANLVPGGRRFFLKPNIFFIGGFAMNLALQIAHCGFITRWSWSMYLLGFCCFDVVAFLICAVDHAASRRIRLYNHAICLAYNRKYVEAIAAFRRLTKKPFSIFENDVVLDLLPWNGFPSCTAARVWTVHLQDKLAIDNMLGRQYLSKLSDIRIRGSALFIQLEFFLCIRKVHFHDAVILHNRKGEINNEVQDMKNLTLILTDVLFVDEQGSITEVASSKMQLDKLWRQKINALILKNSVRNF